MVEPHLNAIKAFVKENKGLYPTCRTDKEIDSIKCYICPNGEKLNGYEGVCGFCFKDEQNINVGRSIFPDLKLYDFMVNPKIALISMADIKLLKSDSTLKGQDISVKSTNENVVILNVNKKEQEIEVSDKELEDIILSTVTHEFMHSISKGFDNKMDEAYTNFYAKELFKIICKEREFYDTYIYDPRYVQVTESTEDMRKLYFIGESSK